LIMFDPMSVYIALFDRIATYDRHPKSLGEFPGQSGLS
jgi:hypothetical protein